MGLNDIIKKLVFTIILLVGLVVGYIYSKPYLPIISSKYQAITHSISQILNNDGDTTEQSRTNQETSTTRQETEVDTTTIEPSTQESLVSEITVETEESSEAPKTTEDTSSPSSRIHPNDFIRVTYTGYDGDGSVKYSVDRQALQDKLQLKAQDLDDFINGLDISLEPTQYLSNGDSVQLFVKVKDSYQDILPNFVVNLKVSGLKERKVFKTEFLKDAINVTLEGYDGLGKLTYDYQFSDPNFKDLQLKELPTDTNLRNGQTITFELTESSKDFLKSDDYILEEDGKFDMTVTGLKPTESVTQEMIDKHVVVNFVGTSGAGIARIDATFQPPLSNYLNKDSFDVQNNGHIKNDETIKISIKPDILEKMTAEGYLVENNGTIERQAKNMLQVSETFDGIKNHKTLKEKVDQQMKDQFPDTLFGSYDIKLERYYYRPYHTENDLVNLEKAKQDGTFIGVYTVTAYDRDKKHIRTKETHVFGYTDLFINDKKEVSLEKPNEFKYKYDETYTLESIYQLLEGFNFSKVTK